MADTSIVAGTMRADRSVPYELGKPNWENRTIPDIRNPASSLQIGEDAVLDVLILGDGFQSQSEFEEELKTWISNFYNLEVYDIFQGAFRIRGLYRESAERASAGQGSYYGVKVLSDHKDVDKEQSLNTFRRRVFEDVDSFFDINLRRYPNALTTLEKRNWLFGMYRNLVVCMLVRTEKADNAGGFTPLLARPHPDEDHTVQFAVGGYSIHEFSHALGLLRDEYIEGRDSRSDRSNPSQKSVLTLSNLTYSDTYSEVPWLHLSPWGRDRRQASGTAPSPVVGWLWVGGVQHRGVWHSEYRCLMNGKHDNFRYTQDAPNDPTWNNGYDDKTNKGEQLRDKARFCLWCQEIVTLQILERTDQLNATSDPPDLVERGRKWYERWTTELRDRYWELFEVSQQIVDYELKFARMNVGPGDEPLDSSDLYSPFREDSPTVGGSSTVDDGAWLLLLG